MDKKRGIFVTGSLGAIGSSLVVHLLLDDQNKVICMLNPLKRSSIEIYKNALRSAAEDARLYKKILTRIDTIHFILGDIDQEMFGISDEEIASLSKKNIKQIWHFSELMKFDEIYREVLFRHNVEGTKNAIEFAKKMGITEFNYLSTAYVSGERVGIIDENPYDKKFEAYNVYEESKQKAEDIILMNKGFLQTINIFRPSIIIGNSNTYQIKSNTGLYAFLINLKRFQEWINARINNYFNNNPLQIYRKKDATINFIPLDMFIKKVLTISNNSSNGANIYHITNPSQTSIDYIIEEIKKAVPDINLKLVDSPDELNHIDNNFHDKLSYINDYLYGNKQFISNKKIDDWDNKPDLIEIKLENYISNFIDSYQNKRIKFDEDAESVMKDLKKKTIKSRFGNDLVYYTTGNGPVIVIVNAYISRIDVWKYIITHYSKTHKVIVWECRGIYDSHYPTNDYIFTIDDQIKDIEKIVHNEKVTKFKLITWCSGAKYTLKYAIANSQKIENLTIITGNFAPFKGYENFMSEFEQAAIAIAQTLQKTPDQASFFVEMIMKTPDTVLDTQVTHKVSAKYNGLVSELLSTPEYLRNYSKQIIDFIDERNNIYDLLSKVKVPTFIIGAENDTISHPKVVQAVAKMIPEAYYLSLPTATHFAIIENPEEVINYIDDFYIMLERKNNNKELM